MEKGDDETKRTKGDVGGVRGAGARQMTACECGYGIGNNYGFCLRSNFCRDSTRAYRVQSIITDVILRTIRFDLVCEPTSFLAAIDNNITYPSTRERQEQRASSNQKVLYSCRLVVITTVCCNGQ